MVCYHSSGKGANLMDLVIALAIAALIIGAICYIVSLIPGIPQFMKQIVYVVAGIIFIILALQKLAVLA